MSTGTPHCIFTAACVAHAPLHARCTPRTRRTAAAAAALHTTTRRLQPSPVPPTTGEVLTDRIPEGPPILAATATHEHARRSAPYIPKPPNPIPLTLLALALQLLTFRLPALLLLVNFANYPPPCCCHSAPGSAVPVAGAAMRPKPRPPAVTTLPHTVSTGPVPLPLRRAAHARLPATLPCREDSPQAGMAPWPISCAERTQHAGAAAAPVAVTGRNSAALP